MPPPAQNQDWTFDKPVREKIVPRPAQNQEWTFDKLVREKIVPWIRCGRQRVESRMPADESRVKHLELQPRLHYLAAPGRSRNAPAARPR